MRSLLESDTRISGHSISFIDIDETTLHTFAKVNVIKDGEIVKSLDNKEFNTHKLGDGETYNFDNFRDAKYFNQTSQPIEKTINRIKNIIQSIKDNNKLEKVIFLTARADFDDKEVFLDTFRNFGIDVDIPNVHVERSGNLTHIQKVADRKKYIILKYLKTGLYTNVRMLDDDNANLKTFVELGKEVNSGKYGILKSVQKQFPKVKKLNFFPLLVKDDGTISKYELSESVNIELVLEDVNAYHGSHKNFEEFDTKFIGTGEEHQVHGWGLYFALTEKVGKGYHKRISGYHENEDSNQTDMIFSYEGKTYKSDTIQGMILKKIYNQGKDRTLRFIKGLESESEFTKNPESFLKNVKHLYTVVSKMDVEKVKEKITIKKGQFYTVKIPDLNTFLDENLKIRDQSPEVIESIKNIMSELKNRFDPSDAIGETFYRTLKYYVPANSNATIRSVNKKVSEFLYNHGISGIKYDGQRDGKCVVVFSKNDVKIVKKEVDYDTGEGDEMSELTKYFDNPDKLKGKRIPDNVINWFIENHPEKITNKTFRDRLSKEQQLKFLVSTNRTDFEGVSLEKLIDEVNTSVDSLFGDIIMMGRNARNGITAEDMIEVINKIPVEERIKYFNNHGLKCFKYYYTANNSEDIVKIINNFFNGISFESIKDAKIDDFGLIYSLNTYKGFCETYRRIIWLINLTGEKSLNLHNKSEITINDKFIDKIAIEEIKKVSFKVLYILFGGDRLNVDNSVMNEFKQLLKYNPKGFCVLHYTYKTPQNIEIMDKMYSDDIMKTFSVIKSINDLPDSLSYFINVFPAKIRFYSDELFREIVERRNVKYKIITPETLKIWGVNKTNIIIRVLIERMKQYINSYGIGYDKELYDTLYNIYKSNIVTDKELVQGLQEMFVDYKKS